MSYVGKGNRTPLTQVSIKSVKPLQRKDVSGGGHFVRAPSVESNKKIGFNRLRNRTLAKVNIGSML